MALALSRQFIRGISQPFDHSVTGISVWTYEQVLAKQEAERVRFLPPPFPSLCTLSSPRRGKTDS